MLKTAFTLVLAATCVLYPAGAGAQNTQPPQRSIPLPEDSQPGAPSVQPQQSIQVTPPTEKSVTVSPPGCDFEVTFPSDPYTSRRCPDGANGRCYDLTRYTMVYDMATTVDVRFSCNPLTPAQYDQYSEQVTRMALNGMAARNNVVQSNTNFSQENAVRRTTLSGSGTSGRQNKIYIAQIWTAQNSMLTMEAELIGNEHPQADAIFGEILRSVKAKTPEEPAADTAPADAPAAQAPASPAAPAPAPAVP